MTIFLKTCRKFIGHQLSEVVLMSDDTDVYYKAWAAIMGVPSHRLLCTWHVDRAWRKNLGKIDGGSIKKAFVYKTIRSLMEIEDIPVFQTKQREFIIAATSDPSTKAFAEYFEREYALREKLWAFCYRNGLKVHHNMHLESLHRVLKHVHMNGRKVNRMDSSIHALLRLMRTKMHDRLLKNNKGKWTRHLLGIRKRHRSSLACEISCVTIIERNLKYEVMSKMNNNVYTVKQNATVPHEAKTCPLLCELCKICCHTFSCTCFDYGLRNTICKHIHLVVRSHAPTISCSPTGPNKYQDDQTKPSLPQEANVTQPFSEEDVDFVVEEVPATSSSSVQGETSIILDTLASQYAPEPCNAQKYLEKAKHLFNLLCSEVENDENAEAAQVLYKQITHANALVTALKNRNPGFPVHKSRQEPANKKVTLQRVFRSTKKKAKKRKSAEKLTKPTPTEKTFFLESLSCGMSSIMSGNEHDYAALPKL